MTLSGVHIDAALVLGGSGSGEVTDGGSGGSWVKQLSKKLLEESWVESPKLSSSRWGPQVPALF